ncbi:MAG: hypothetical protein JHC33_15280 [Ignisphaera sp.]|nr:hypothetical protein [Ignisphaera sp.]
MANFKTYKEALEKLGLKQLDVYRLKNKDIVRVLRLNDGKVLLVELPKHREEMGVEEFINIVRSKIEAK